jgi:hypothetical protein
VIPVKVAKKENHAEIQEAATQAVHAPYNDAGVTLGNRQQVLIVVSSLCAFLAIAAFVVLAVIRSRRHSTPQGHAILPL